MMTDNTLPDDDSVLDSETLNLLSDAPQAMPASKIQMQNLRARVMQRVAESAASSLTIRAGDGAWLELAPGIQKKTLFADPASGIESYLLRAEAGAELPAHRHELDEHCLVLEGDVGYGDSIELGAGDYHLALTGSDHEIARTQTGALVYIQMVPANALR